MKTVLEMAQEAGLRSAVLLRLYGKTEALCESELEELERIKRFARLVRADEREACAVAGGLACRYFEDSERVKSAIRARGNT